MGLMGIDGQESWRGWLGSGGPLHPQAQPHPTSAVFPAAPRLDSSEEESWGWTLRTAWAPHPPLAVCAEAPRGWEMGCCGWEAFSLRPGFSRACSAEERRESEMARCACHGAPPASGGGSLWEGAVPLAPDPWVGEVYPSGPQD